MFNVLFYRNPLYAMSNKNDNYIFPKKLFSLCLMARFMKYRYVKNIKYRII